LDRARKCTVTKILTGQVMQSLTVTSLREREVVGSSPTSTPHNYNIIPMQ
jgi:hypothetical protein